MARHSDRKDLIPISEFTAMIPGLPESKQAYPIKFIRFHYQTNEMCIKDILRMSTDSHPSQLSGMMKKIFEGCPDIEVLCNSFSIKARNGSCTEELYCTGMYPF